MQIRHPLFFYLFCTVSTISAWTSNCISILFVSQKPHLPVILLHMKRSIMRSLSVIALLLWVRNFHFPLILAAVAAISFTIISYHSLNASTSGTGSWKIQYCFQSCISIKWLRQTRVFTYCVLIWYLQKGRFIHCTWNDSLFFQLIT